MSQHVANPGTLDQWQLWAGGCPMQSACTACNSQAGDRQHAPPKAHSPISKAAVHSLCFTSAAGTI